MSEQSTFQPPHVTEAEQALEKERHLPLTGWQQEVSQGLTYGLEAADSIRDRSIPTFSRGELPHYAGINTFMKAPYLEYVRNVFGYPVIAFSYPSHHTESKYIAGTIFFSLKNLFAGDRPQNSSSSALGEPVIFLPPIFIQTSSFGKVLSINSPVLCAALIAFFARVSTLMLICSFKVQSRHFFKLSAWD